MENKKLKTGLVIEGGGTKIGYTAGVLQCLLDHGITFPYAAAISSGAVVAMPYISGQRDRLRVTGVDSPGGAGAVGLKPLLREGCIFGINAACDYLEKHAPMDFETLQASDTELEIGVYNMEAHAVEYFGKEHIDRRMLLPKAGCALLLLAKPFVFNGTKYFDAGLVDMISVERALEKGCDKVLVLSTKEAGYRRAPAPAWQRWLAKAVYRDETIVRQFKDRHLRYEEQWEMVQCLENDGKALVLRPGKNMGITRYTTSRSRLEPWFELGYTETEARIPEILSFCEN